MKTTNNYETNIGSIKKLLLAIRYDPVINNKVKILLNMEDYPRRLVLNNWLEQLRRKEAPEELIKTLSYLFDDNISKNILTIVNSHHIQDI